MGVLRSTQSLQAEVDELRAALGLAGSGGHGEAAGGGGWRRSAGRGHADAKRAPGGDAGAGAAARAVCVTGGISFVGFAVVDRLLRHGFTVRLALETQGQHQPSVPSSPPVLPPPLLLVPRNLPGFFSRSLALCHVDPVRFCVLTLSAPLVAARRVAWRSVSVR